MQFKNLKVMECPTCGCSEVVAESVDVSSWQAPREIREHCNGERWERRTFLCGFEVAWCPNFGRAEVKEVCPSDPQLIQLRARLDKAREDKNKAEQAAKDLADKLYEYRKGMKL